MEQKYNFFKHKLIFSTAEDCPILNIVQPIELTF